MSEKTFEDYFSELQADMVSIALEYVNGNADSVYIYASKEKNMLAFDVFYKIKGEFFHRHHLEDAYDASGDRQGAMLKIGMDTLQSINELCSEYTKDMPTEIRMIYQVNDGSFEAKYRYDSVYFEKKIAPSNIFDQWFDEIKNE